MVEAKSPISICQQCDMLSISRGYYYYHPVELSDMDLKLMEKIDELYTEDPTLGTRRISHALSKRFNLKAGRAKGPPFNAYHAHRSDLPQKEIIDLQFITQEISVFIT